MKLWIRIASVVTLVAVCAVFSSYLFLAPFIQFDAASENKNRHGILFVGDIMLARNVETVMNQNGFAHPYWHVTALHKQYENVVGNFEGTIPKSHRPTAPFTFSFSVNDEAIRALSDSRVTHVSLANNHALDFGDDAFRNTREVLAEHHVTAFGDPVNVSTTTASIIDVDGTRVGVIGIHAVWKEPDRQSMRIALRDLVNATDVQIAYIHWGIEYEKVNDVAQDALARELVSLGVDAIIGHHPHVVQNISLINDVPVFYSLGNYIFDQYWDESVEEGLAIGLGIENRQLRFDLIPLKSSRSVPVPLEGEERQAFLRALAQRSDTALQDAVAHGVIESRIRSLAPTEIPDYD